MVRLQELPNDIALMICSIVNEEANLKFSELYKTSTEVIRQRDGRASLSNLTRSCTKFYRLGQPLLFRDFGIAKTRYDVDLFFQTVIERPHLARLVRRVNFLQPRAQPRESDPRFKAFLRNPPTPTARYIDPPPASQWYLRVLAGVSLGNELESTLVAFLAFLPNLEWLRYAWSTSPFQLSCDLHALLRRTGGGTRLNYFAITPSAGVGAISLEGIAPILTLPALSSIRTESLVVRPCLLAPGSSRITHLDLRYTKMGIQGLCTLARACATLKSVKFTAAGPRPAFHAPDAATEEPETNPLQFIRGLEPHALTLDCLDIDLEPQFHVMRLAYPHFFIPHRSHRIESLRSFIALKCLSISQGCLRTNETDTDAPVGLFAKLLPPSITTLTLKSVDNGLLDAIKQLASTCTLERPRHPYLKEVTIFALYNCQSEYSALASLFAQTKIQYEVAVSIPYRIPGMRKRPLP